MSFAVDTNVLLRSIDEGHPAQSITEKALLHLRNRGEVASIFPQNLIEFWAVATRPLANNGLGWKPERAAKEITELQRLFVLLDDIDAIFLEWQKLVIRHHVLGKQAHDAHIVAAMLVHGVNQLLTFNDADFKRYNEITAVNPHDVT